MQTPDLSLIPATTLCAALMVRVSNDAQRTRGRQTDLLLDLLDALADLKSDLRSAYAAEEPEPRLYTARQLDIFTQLAETGRAA